MSDKVTVRVSIQTNMVGSKVTELVEFDKAEWDSMSDAGREEVLFSVAMNNAEWNWAIV